VSDCRIEEQSINVLSAYATVPVAFEVARAYDVSLVEKGLGGVSLTARDVEEPWVKDYDALGDGGPAKYSERWDVNNWGVFAAFVDGARVGGCVIARDTPGMDKLEGRKDIAALWDLRVHPDHRRTGIGTKLVTAAVDWARDKGCRILKAETQNINIAACNLYAGCGFVLGVVDRFAYDDLPSEVELVWYRGL